MAHHIKSVFPTNASYIVKGEAPHKHGQSDIVVYEHHPIPEFNASEPDTRTSPQAEPRLNHSWNDTVPPSMGREK